MCGYIVIIKVTSTPTPQHHKYHDAADSKLGNYIYMAYIYMGHVIQGAIKCKAHGGGPRCQQEGCTKCLKWEAMQGWQAKV